MEDTTLLSMLQELEENSAQFVWGTLAQERRVAAKEYYRQPYGNEEDGWSSIVTSEVQDTVEWILPDLIDMFLSSDDAVIFEPTQAADSKGAEQATDAANYVFYKQNNGFLTLYTAFKDALMFKNCAVHWRKETLRTNRKERVNGATAEMIAYLQKERGAKIAAAEETEPQPLVDQMGMPVLDADGQPIMQTLINALVSVPTERRVIKIDAFEPDNLLIQRDWTSPMLADCPYVARNLEVTLSDLKQMGFDDVEAEELAASTQPGVGESIEQRRSRRGLTNELNDPINEVSVDDESLTRGYLRIEWVLVDYDDDGIAERREIYRLNDKILSNEECDEVPVSTGSPLLVQHRWDGMSVAEIMSDLQMLKTELTRGVVNNAYASNNPRKMVLVDKQGAPQADVDDLLDGRPGGHIRIKSLNAVTMEPTSFTGNQMFPLLEYVDQMGEKRIGVSKQQQGLDPNALRPDRTAAEVMMTANAAKARIKLIARILAETVVKPIFKGVLRLLTEGDMQPLAFKLRGEFVELDPNEWNDGYDMTVNVGLGTGDKDKQLAVLGKVFETQMGLAQSPLGEMMVTPHQIYTTQAKMIALGGFKNVGDFLKDPGEAPLPGRPQQPPDPALQIAQIKAQSQQQIEMVKLQAQAQSKQMELDQQAALERQRMQLQAEVDNNRQRAEAEQHALKIRNEADLAAMRAQYEDLSHQREQSRRWDEAQLAAATKIQVATVMSKDKVSDPATAAATNEIATEVTQ
ncbi:portal protein [Variovorax sp. ZT5P49]